MRAIILISVAIFLVSIATASAREGRSMYAVVDVKAIDSSENTRWKYLDNNGPRYSKELAMGNFMGCVITSFEISESGRTNKVKVVSSVPEGGLARPISRMMKQVKWKPIEEGDSPEKEQKTLRLNFCLSEVSYEEANKLCAKVSKLPCE